MLLYESKTQLGGIRTFATCQKRQAPKTFKIIDLHRLRTVFSLSSLVFQLSLSTETKPLLKKTPRILIFLNPFEAIGGGTIVSPPSKPHCFRLGGVVLGTRPPFVVMHNAQKMGKGALGFNENGCIIRVLGDFEMQSPSTGR